MDGWMDSWGTDGISGFSEQEKEVVLALISDVWNNTSWQQCHEANIFVGKVSQYSMLQQVANLSAKRYVKLMTI